MRQTLLAPHRILWCFSVVLSSTFCPQCRHLCLPLAAPPASRPVRSFVWIGRPTPLTGRLQRLGCNQIRELLDRAHQCIPGFSHLLNYPIVPTIVRAGLLLRISYRERSGGVAFKRERTRCVPNDKALRVRQRKIYWRFQLACSLTGLAVKLFNV